MSATKPKAKIGCKNTKGSQQRAGKEPRLSGERSKGFWKTVNEANDIPSLRMAIYAVACQCQELESEIRRLSTAKLSDREGGAS